MVESASLTVPSLFVEDIGSGHNPCLPVMASLLSLFDEENLNNPFPLEDIILEGAFPCHWLGHHNLRECRQGENINSTLAFTILNLCPEY